MCANRPVCVLTSAGRFTINPKSSCSLVVQSSNCPFSCCQRSSPASSSHLCSDCHVNSPNSYPYKSSHVLPNLATPLPAGKACRMRALGTADIPRVWPLLWLEGTANRFIGALAGEAVLARSYKANPYLRLATRLRDLVLALTRHQTSLVTGCHDLLQLTLQSILQTCRTCSQVTNPDPVVARSRLSLSQRLVIEICTLRP